MLSDEIKKPEHARSPGSKMSAKLLQRASFLLSTPNLRDLPADEGYEVALVGRSNSGKSSVLNALYQQRGLARTSNTPGRTQQLVVFQLDQMRRLVDLPGFGYAKVSKTKRAQWDRVLGRYFEVRAALAGVVMVCDARHELKEVEAMMVHWCAELEIPLAMLLNKADKLTQSKAQAMLKNRRATVAKLPGEVSVMLCSARTKRGLDAVYEVMGGWLAVSE
ncbi:MAG: ribosome biogenesis GTP-binding protein YihA/YsxC [Pseudomonadota bacterium]